MNADIMGIHDIDQAIVGYNYGGNNVHMAVYIHILASSLLHNLVRDR